MARPRPGPGQTLPIYTYISHRCTGMWLGSGLQFVIQIKIECGYSCTDVSARSTHGHIHPGPGTKAISATHPIKLKTKWNEMKNFQFVCYWPVNLITNYKHTNALTSIILGAVWRASLAYWLTPYASVMLWVAAEAGRSHIVHTFNYLIGTNGRQKHLLLDNILDQINFKFDFYFYYFHSLRYDFLYRTPWRIASIFNCWLVCLSRLFTLLFQFRFCFFFFIVNRSMLIVVQH